MAQKITDEYLGKKIKLLKKSAKKNRFNPRPGKRRFGLYDYLSDLYAVYLELESKGLAKKAARKLIKRFHLRVQKGTHLLRVLIEVSAGPEDVRQKSRWTQALRYVLGWKAPPEKAKQYLKWGPGIAGCARKQAMNTRGARQRALATASNSGDPMRAQGELEPSSQ